MMILLEQVQALAKLALLRITSADVKLRDSAGTYDVEVVGPVLEALEGMESESSLAEIVGIGGIAHDPSWQSYVPCFITAEGIRFGGKIDETLKEEVSRSVSRALAGAH